LGSSAVLSRNHCSIKWISTDHCFGLYVSGKNGVVVEDKYFQPIASIQSKTACAVEKFLKEDEFIKLGPFTRLRIGDVNVFFRIATQDHPPQSTTTPSK
jgi:hypothetical protein